MMRLGSVLFVIVLLPVVMVLVWAEPTPTIGLIYYDSTATSPGYTMFPPMNYPVAYLIDNRGMLVKSWRGAYTPGLSANLCTTGQFLRTCYVGNRVFTAGGAGGRVELVDWDGETMWAFTYSNNLVCQHHDAVMLPNGNVLMLAWEYKSRSEAIAAGRDSTLLVYNCLWPDHLIEVDPDNDSIVWEWHVWDHLIQDYDSTKANYGDPRAHPELIDLNYVAGLAVADWNHSNGIAYNPELDQVVISVRQFSEIWVIDHSTTTAEAAGHTGGRYGRGGDLLYRWGNPQTYRRGNTIGQTLFGQHDAQWIPPGLPGAGHILVFNNGLGRTPVPYSSVDEFVPPMDSAGFYHLGPDSAYGPAEPVWSYVASPRESLYSSTISGCQRLANGNTLICAGETGTIFEVTPDHRLVWKYINPVTRNGPQMQGSILPIGSNMVFKARKYAPDYPGLAGRQLDPQGPIETYPQAVAEGPVSGQPGRRCPTVVTGMLRLAGAESAELIDASGRRQARLAPVLNDIGWLPAGVYFLRTGSGLRTEKVVVRR
ncbi:MAG: aryl-sulfate sulfotransferase [candidate division WOR-3 bacterium]